MGEEGNPVQLEYKPTGAEGHGYQEYNKLESQQKIEAASKEARMQREKHRRAQIADEDEAWAKDVNARLMELPFLEDEDTGGKKEKKKEKKEKKKQKKKEKKEKKKEK